MTEQNESTLGASELSDQLGGTLDILNRILPCNPPWGEGQYVPVIGVSAVLAEKDSEIDRLHDLLIQIGNFAHNASTGPAVPDALWEIRSMAYGGIDA